MIDVALRRRELPFYVLLRSCDGWAMMFSLRLKTGQLISQSQTALYLRRQVNLTVHS